MLLMWPFVNGFIRFDPCVCFFRNVLSTCGDNVGYGGDVKIDEHFAEVFSLMWLHGDGCSRW